jgi:DMSO/TMAO reductase YedYZ heme-binding membrane subunit
MWYMTRGAGLVTLILLTGVVVLGIVTSVRWKSEDWPRFLISALHRNLSLFLVAFGALHIVTAIFDPTAYLGPQALIPFVSDYRTVWLSLGVISGDLVVAIVVTSLLRVRLGYLAWRIIHWLTYLSWPLAMLHTLGTGTDPHAGWFLLLAAGCTASIIAALFWRLGRSLNEHPNLRFLGQGTCALSALALVIWTASGPMQSGWARTAGTPGRFLASGNGSTGTAAALAPGMDDQLQGSLTQTNDGRVEVNLSDTQNPGLQLTLDVAAQGARQANLTASQDGTPICQAPASIANTVTAQCGQTQLTIMLQSAGRRSNSVVGELITESA